MSFFGNPNAFLSANNPQIQQTHYNYSQGGGYEMDLDEWRSIYATYGTPGPDGHVYLTREQLQDVANNSIPPVAGFINRLLMDDKMWNHVSQFNFPGDAPPDQTRGLSLNSVLRMGLTPEQGPNARGVISNQTLRRDGHTVHFFFDRYDNLSRSFVDQAMMTDVPSNAIFNYPDWSTLLGSSLLTGGLFDASSFLTGDGQDESGNIDDTWTTFWNQPTFSNLIGNVPWMGPFSQFFRGTR